MTCKTIMVQPPATLRPTDTVAAAVERLSETGAPALPVADDHGRFLGVFGFKQALAAVLPRAARLGDDLGDLAYVKESVADLKKRFSAIADKHVRGQMADHVTAKPDTSVTEALLLLERGDMFLPVVEGDKLVGVITASQAMSLIAEGR